MASYLIQQVDSTGTLEVAAGGVDGGYYKRVLHATLTILTG